MNGNLLEHADSLFEAKLNGPESAVRNPGSRSPVHVVYGGAHLFKRDLIEKLGRIALNSLETYAPNFIEFADALWLKGVEKLPKHDDLIQDLEFRLADDPVRVKAQNYEAWFAWTIYHRVIDKLKREPVEDFRIDFEDGYGLRADEEEDAHAVAASDELAAAFAAGALPAFGGFRVKSFQNETFKRAVRTLDLFFDNLFERTGRRLPGNFVVTLPKITRVAEVEIMAELLAAIEKTHDLAVGSLRFEIMIETPPAVALMSELVAAGGNRIASAHFGAFDYTASYGITAQHQHLQHDACRLARQLMQLRLAPLGLRLSDSVTTEMPVPLHRGGELSEKQKNENKRAVHHAWRRHYNNVTQSLINGFYQSWDLHPAQLAARYGAVYAFFLESADEQAARLKNFIGKATQAMLTGSQFDDAASAQGLLNFFTRAVACGAMTTAEVSEKTGLNEADLEAASFAQIVKS